VAADVIGVDPWSWLFPGVCLACRALLQRPRVPALCARCGHAVAPLPADVAGLANIAACYPYDGPLAAALWQLKFRGRLDLAGPLGAILAQAPIWSAGWDAIVPVPLPRRRTLTRGYNQAALLAAAARRRRPRAPSLAAGWLTRPRGGPPVRDLPVPARAAVVQDAFTVPRPAKVAGRRILLVDDVTTTGATLTACRAALAAAGAAQVGALALLRTLA
jgi:ComF family protein